MIENGKLRPIFFLFLFDLDSRHVYVISILWLYYMLHSWGLKRWTTDQNQGKTCRHGTITSSYNIKWNINTLLQINICIPLRETLLWQTDSFVFATCFISHFRYCKIKALFVFWTVAILASCGLCSQLMLLVVQDKCLKKFVIYWIPFYEVL